MNFKLSINLTIHNKGFLLADVLSRIVEYTDGPFELVCVLDGCTDNSAAVLDHFCWQKKVFPKIFTAPNVFQCRANNLAARNSTGDFIIIAEDDALIDEPGWNERILRPFTLWSDVFAVTGKTAHNCHTNPDSRDIRTGEIPDNRWQDILRWCDEANRHNTLHDTFAIRDTVNRPFLAFRHTDLETMGYFDEAFAPQSCDDHDLMYRMHAKLGKVCGMVPIRWHDRPEWGGTRPGGQTAPWAYAAENRNVRLLIERHAEAMKRRTIESRSL